MRTHSAGKVIPLLTPFQPSQDINLQLQYNVLVSLGLVSINPHSQTLPAYLTVAGNVSPLVQFTDLNPLLAELAGLFFPCVKHLS